MKIVKKLLKPVDEYSWEGNTGEAIMLHITAGGNYKGAEDTLIARHLSYHFIIDMDGTVNQLVDIGRSAWHAGIKSNPKPEAVKFFQDINPNRRSIGISFVCPQDFWGNDINDKQYTSAVELIKYIGTQTGVRYTAKNIFSHGDVTDYKEHMVEEKKRLIEELVGYKDEKDVVVLEGILKRLQERLKRLLNGN